jgi:hypothetical protein
LKEGETVMLPEYGGTEVKLAEKEYVMLPLKICCSKCNPKSKKIQATRELWLHFGRLLSEQGSL